MLVPIVADDGVALALTAVVALDCREGIPNPIPAPIIAAVGQSMLDAGDAAV